MSLLTMRFIIAGAIFGAALTAAGVYQPSIIIGQVRLEDFYMMKAFLVANFLSTIFIGGFNYYSDFLACSPLKPRSASSLGLFNLYDGNVIGGALLGLGMALTGACPGTVLPQVATGVPSGFPVLLGCILGGTLFSGFKKLYSQQSQPCSTPSKPSNAKSAINNNNESQPLSSQSTSSESNSEAPNNHTTSRPPTTLFPEVFNRNVTSAVFHYLCLLLQVICATYDLFPSTTTSPFFSINSLKGGILIAFSQGLSLLLTCSPLGMSAAYEQLGALALHLLTRFFALFTSSAVVQPLPNNFRTAFFTLGGLLGALMFNQKFGAVGGGGGSEMDIGYVRAILGGTMLGIGGRVAGGCTSGHGITGMSLLGVSSFVTVGAMFGTGVVVGHLGL